MEGLNSNGNEQLPAVEFRLGQTAIFNERSSHEVSEFQLTAHVEQQDDSVPAEDWLEWAAAFG